MAHPPIPNERGVVIAGGAQLNTVGGSAESARNTISGNRTDGVLITGAGTNRNTVRGNYIGTTQTGNAAVANVVGVNITAGARLNTVGGPLNAPRSLISGNTTAGVRVADSATLDNWVQGNLIGTGPGGIGPLANGAGVIVTAGAQATTIGGAGALGNRIAFNGGSGVLVDGAATTGAEITGTRSSPTASWASTCARRARPWTSHAERPRRPGQRTELAPELPRDHGGDGTPGRRRSRAR